MGQKARHVSYRNLFLGFESLLSKLKPINRREREVDWFKRVLDELGIVAHLDTILPQHADGPITSFIENQYKAIRCNLFHAKSDDAIDMQKEILPTTVSDALENLHRIWRLLVERNCNVPGGGGVITNIGFEKMVGTHITNSPDVCVSSDPTIPKKSDTVINPTDAPLLNLNNIESNPSFSPGKVAVFSNSLTNIFTNNFTIFRFGIVVSNNLWSIWYFPEGIIPLGFDYFETAMYITLKNTSTPDGKIKALR